MIDEKKVDTNNNEKYKPLMDLNIDGICELNSNGKIVEINPAFQKMSGYSRDELLDLHFTHLMFADQSELLRGQFEAYDGQVITEFECKFKNKIGRCLYLSSTIIPIFVVNELRGMYVISKDITEQTLSFRKNQYMLTHSQRIAGVGSWELNPNSQISYWSEELFHIYGIENTGYINISKAVEYIHSDDRERFSESVKALLSGDPYDIEFRIIRPDGEIRTLRSKREMLVDEDEVRLIGTVQDISEQKRTQEILIKSEKLSAVGQMAAGVAHEIRNPLTSLKGFLKMILQAENPQRYIEIMDNELNRIETVTNELLMLAKPHVKQFKLIDLAQKLTNVLHVLNTQALMKSIEVCMNVKADVPFIECEPSQLEQVFVNLIKNAIEATPRGGKVFVEMMQTDNEEFILRIIDSGPGIPEENIPRLGEPFFSTKENGTGLGLMISQKIILEHHGKFDLTSEVGKGTQVSIVLPRTQPENR